MPSHVQFACIIEHGADIQSHLKCDDSKNIFMSYCKFFMYTHPLNSKLIIWHLVITQVL